MKYGNCVLGAFILWFRLGGGRLHILKRLHTSIPHFMIYKNGWYYHYKLEKDIVYWPFDYLIFKGRFVKQNRIYTDEVICWRK